MVIDEDTRRLQRLEDERHRRVSAEQEQLMLKYLDCVNNHTMTIDEFVGKINDFDDYWADVEAEKAKQKSIEIPLKYRKGLPNK